MNLDTQRLIESVEARHSRAYSAAIGDLLVAIARGDKPGAASARARLQEVTTETMGIGEAMGAMQVLRAAAGVFVDTGGARFARDMRHLIAFREPAAPLADVTFAQAIDALLARTPTVLVDAAERTAQRIAQLYGEKPIIAFARSAEMAVTERVKALIMQAIQDGIPEAETGRLIKMGVDQIRKETEAWTEAYSRMAFRTNLNTAVTAGRFRQAQDQDVRAAIPAFRFDAVGDADTRDNHQAADGRIWRASNPIWNKLAPPLAWNCRCSASLVTAPMLRRMGRLTSAGDVIEDSVPPGAFPDPGFRHGGRPDLMLAGVA